MLARLFAFILALGALAMPASAKVLIAVDEDTQQMSVSIDGVQTYLWPVSTGKSGYETPTGDFAPNRMEKDHFSKEWDDAPMPHSIFFTDRGHAIHGSRETRRLGHTASRGCVRLSTANAATLYALVEQTGMANTEIVISGSGGSLADWPGLPGGASVPHVNLGPEWSALYEPTVIVPVLPAPTAQAAAPADEPVAPDKASPYPKPAGGQ